MKLSQILTEEELNEIGWFGRALGATGRGLGRVAGALSATRDEYRKGKELGYAAVKQGKPSVSMPPSTGAASTSPPSSAGASTPGSPSSAIQPSMISSLRIPDQINLMKSIIERVSDADRPAVLAYANQKLAALTIPTPTPPPTP
jgi:hypothetical protein